MGNAVLLSQTSSPFVQCARQNIESLLVHEFSIISIEQVLSLCCEAILKLETDYNDHIRLKQRHITQCTLCGF